MPCIPISITLHLLLFQTPTIQWPGKTRQMLRIITLASYVCRFTAATAYKNLRVWHMRRPFCCCYHLPEPIYVVCLWQKGIDPCSEEPIQWVKMHINSILCRRTEGFPVSEWEPDPISTQTIILRLICGNLCTPHSWRILNSRTIRFLQGISAIAMGVVVSICPRWQVVGCSHQLQSKLKGVFVLPIVRAPLVICTWHLHSW